jgi:hypothetical protein
MCIARKIGAELGYLQVLVDSFYGDSFSKVLGSHQWIALFLSFSFVPFLAFPALLVLFTFLLTVVFFDIAVNSVTTAAFFFVAVPFFDNAVFFVNTEL